MEHRKITMEQDTVYVDGVRWHTLPLHQQLEVAQACRKAHQWIVLDVLDRVYKLSGVDYETIKLMVAEYGEINRDEQMFRALGRDLSAHCRDETHRKHLAEAA